MNNALQNLSFSVINTDSISDTERKKFSEFVLNANHADIFQDPKWALVSAAKGWKRSHIITVREDTTNEILIGALAYTNSAKFAGDYLYIQHGPIVAAQLQEATDRSNKSTVEAWGEIPFADETSRDIFNYYLSELATYCKTNDYFALVIEPLATEKSEMGQLFLDSDYLAQLRGVLPKYTMYMDLSVSEEELLAQVDKKTRYYIRYAKKQGVEVEFHYPDMSKGKNEAISKFVDVLEEFAKGKGFKYPSKKFFETAAKEYDGQGKICFALAKHNGEIVSANFTQLYGNWASSYYTANSRRFSKLRASYILKWETILEAKRQGKDVFDMWGQIPNLPKTHSEYGYGQFKRSFNPIQKTMSGRVILPINKFKYWIWKTYGLIQYRISH